MDGQKLSVLMEQFKPNYTKSELKLFNYIVENLESVMYNSLTELSERCIVGEATILRFCRKIGFNGYQEFKLAIAQELTMLRASLPDEDHFINRIKSNTLKAIGDTFDAIDEKQLEKAIDWIDNYDEIVVYGVGHSGLTALDLQSKLMRIGKNVQVVIDPHFQIMRSCSASERTLIIAISITGRTKDIVDSVGKAKENNAKVIAITSFVRSPLTKFSDIVLLTSGKENPLDGGSMVGKVSQLFVVDLLCTGFVMKDMEKAQHIKTVAAEAVTSKMY
ncbi:MurR/RpiR family transcriptional regulator [Fusibacter bizertensis]